MNYIEFAQLMKTAHKETRFLSGVNHNNKNIRKIIEEANSDTVAFSCLFLEEYTHLALCILYELVVDEKPPIPDYYRGRIPVILECWKYWALKNGYVKIEYDPSAYWVEDKYGNRGDWH